MWSVCVCVFTQSKRVLSENKEPATYTRISSLPSFPPLPCSPLSQDSERSRKNSLHQISSPLVSFINTSSTTPFYLCVFTHYLQERMTLMSPGVHTNTSKQLYGSGDNPFTFPPHVARGLSVESDGYNEEVFDREDSSSANSLPSGLTTLMNAPFTKKEVCIYVWMHWRTCVYWL